MCKNTRKLPLQSFMDDPNLEISNNRTERTIKTFVIGRKNFLFSSA
ncbi:transposase, partial [bacterium AH-315-G05]|nr:transposase [bacterium AH-315-G05]